MRPEPCKVQGCPALYVVQGGLWNENPPFSKGGKKNLLSIPGKKALLPLKMGGREGFLGRPFRTAGLSRSLAFHDFINPENQPGCSREAWSRTRAGCDGVQSTCPNYAGYGRCGNFPDTGAGSPDRRGGRSFRSAPWPGVQNILK